MNALFSFLQIHGWKAKIQFLGVYFLPDAYVIKNNTYVIKLKAQFQSYENAVDKRLLQT
jgi:hypothetical protein